MKHKVFLSHFHEDDKEVKEFVDTFSGENGIFIPKIVGDDYDTTINSNDSQYIMRKIREDYLTDSTVTIVLIGENTYKRKYVDWEIASTLRNDTYNKRSGLIGIFLKGKNVSTTNIPERLLQNIASGYAKIYEYPTNKFLLDNWIEDAIKRRDDDYYKINNSLELYKYNRT